MASMEHRTDPQRLDVHFHNTPEKLRTESMLP
jgi:hypothetical protein